MPIKKTTTATKAEKAEKLPPKADQPRAGKAEENIVEKIIAKDPEVINNDILDVDNFVFDTKKKYLEAVGRRKNATARVRLYTQNKKGVTINDKPYQDYFKTEVLQKTIIAPLEKLKCLDKFGFEIKVNGGGLSGQAGAIRHAISRVLVLLNPYFKKRLKKSGYLTRDSRMRERKKPGLNRARRAPQWSKR